MVDDGEKQIKSNQKKLNDFFKKKLLLLFVLSM
jgi:hypothetical protein